jgi:predicted dehydrogenase
MKQLRIGFLSTAGIGKRNWKAIFHSGNCVVAAVASRDEQKSRVFIDDCQRDFPFAETPHALGSYEELLAAPNVDAIYIPLPTSLRKEFVLRTAAAGKHVICEKPCAVSAAELDEMISACHQHNVQFMDGVMFMHSPRLAKIRAALDDGQSIGQIRRIASGFSFYVGDEFFRSNIRTDGTLEPAGCLGDLGWYSIRFALWTLNWKLPQAVTAKIHAASPALPGRLPAPTEFSAELTYDGGLSVEFYCSFLAGRQQWIHVSGQKGWLWMPDFVHPRNSYEPEFEVSQNSVRVASATPCPPGTDSAAQGHATAQDTQMFRNFADQVFTGQLNADWPMWAVKTQQVLDACQQAARSGTAIKI